MSDQTTTPAPARQPIPKSELPAPPREVLAGAPSLLPLGPWTVRVAKHTWGERNEIEQLVRDRTPQPLAEFRRRLDLFDRHPVVQEKLIDSFLDAAYIADREWPPAFLSRGFLSAIFSPGNVPDVLRIALGRLNPEAIAAIVTYAQASSQMEEGAAAEFAGQYEAIAARWLTGSRAETRESIREAADPKGGGGEEPPAATPPPASESTATSPPSSDGDPPTSTP